MKKKTTIVMTNLKLYLKQVISLFHTFKVIFLEYYNYRIRIIPRINQVNNFVIFCLFAF